MATFLSPTNLVIELKQLISESENLLILISPYIKLHDEIKRLLDKKVENPNFQLIVVFGKNETDLSKSIGQNDFEYLKNFQNVEIRYVENLHAKYYANEYKSIITSLNLHSFSIKNNIEVGVLFQQKFGAKVLNYISENLAKESNSDIEAYEFFKGVIGTSELYFEKKPNIKSSWFGLVKKQDGNIVDVDKSAEMYKEKSIVDTKTNSLKKGYCIRTGVEIDFNFKVPFSKEAYKSWAQFKNESYPEKFCHFSGEKSNGETCFKTPVLRKYYSDAKRR